ncbi:MAG TPA: hypothetical protein PKA50_15065, partial [Gemmatimonadales bacterium]|nr:hypothetical protein [Gemmatimonadales bacterium]
MVFRKGPTPRVAAMPLSRRTSLVRLVLGAALAAAPLGAQQPLTLGEALARADTAGYANRIAAGATQARAGDALAPYRGILPSVRLEAAYLRTTDPLNSFGFLLRQRAVTPAAFNPATLNDPAAIGNLMTGVVVEQPLFNADAWLGRSAARAAGAPRHGTVRGASSRTLSEYADGAPARLLASSVA